MMLLCIITFIPEDKPEYNIVSMTMMLHLVLCFLRVQCCTYSMNTGVLLWS